MRDFRVWMRMEASKVMPMAGSERVGENGQEWEEKCQSMVKNGSSRIMVDAFKVRTRVADLE